MEGLQRNLRLFFYEELEEGVLEIGKANVHHYAPSKTGDPVRGYLVSIPTIDHGKLSVLEARNNFAKEIGWANAGALAAGTKVLVYTRPVNQSAKWIQELIKAGAANQELYPSKKITTMAKDYAAVTVTTEAGQKRASAFVTVDIKITDDTVVPVSKIELDQSELAFEITRTLEGERRNPKETYTVTPSKRLYEKVTPEYADNKEVSWSAGDSDILRVDKESVVSVRENAKWITDLIQAEKEKQKENPYGECNASGTRSSYVTATTKDGEKQAVCGVNISFKTMDAKGWWVQ